LHKMLQVLVDKGAKTAISANNQSGTSKLPANLNFIGHHSEREQRVS